MDSVDQLPQDQPMETNPDLVRVGSIKKENVGKKPKKRKRARTTTEKDMDRKSSKYRGVRNRDNNTCFEAYVWENDAKKNGKGRTG
ncbi:hypothetical protein TSUD_263330 [Trifolium subterraneum]|uniref:Uncharacterized protein n=1 Tax=Trifolium subterraneum TaxID=3900 RepID=A0A2Z6NUD3_TRISU|nr:hypothetical protein TSUD_263330 [Trifolium subterraneum]